MEEAILGLVLLVGAMILYFKIVSTQKETQ
jgi:hypothetical protein